jgi:hypothetical protein
MQSWISPTDSPTTQQKSLSSALSEGEKVLHTKHDYIKEEEEVLTTDLQQNPNTT